MPTIFPTRSRIAAPAPLHGDLDAVATKRAANLIAAKSLREGKKLGRRRSGSFGAPADNSSFGRFPGDSYGSDTDDDGNDMSMSIHMHQPPPPPSTFTTTSRNLPPLKTLGRNFYANRRTGGSIRPGGEQQFTAPLEQSEVVPQPAYRKNGFKLQNHPRAPAFAAGDVSHGVAYAANQQLNVGENMLFDMMHERRRAEELVSAAEISKQRLLQPSPTDTEASIGSLGGLGRVGFGAAEADFFAAEEEDDEAVEPGSSWILPGADSLESGSALPLTSSSSSSSSSASSSRNTSKRSRRGQGNKAGKGHFGSMNVPVGLTDPFEADPFDEVTRRYQISKESIIERKLEEKRLLEGAYNRETAREGKRKKSKGTSSMGSAATGSTMASSAMNESTLLQRDQENERPPPHDLNKSLSRRARGRQKEKNKRARSKSFSTSSMRGSDDDLASLFSTASVGVDKLEVGDLCDGFRHMKPAVPPPGGAQENMAPGGGAGDNYPAPGIIVETAAQKMETDKPSTADSMMVPTQGGRGLRVNQMEYDSAKRRQREQAGRGPQSPEKNAAGTITNGNKKKKGPQQTQKEELDPIEMVSLRKPKGKKVKPISNAQRFYEVCKFGNVNVVRILLHELTENMNVTQFSEMASSSPAVFAAVEANKNALEVTTFLLKNGFNPNVRSAQNQETPLICLVKKLRHGTNAAWIQDKDSMGVCKLLLSHRGDVNARDVHKRTALWYAAKFNNEGLAKFLLNPPACADPRIPDRKGLLPSDVTTNNQIADLLYLQCETLKNAGDFGRHPESLQYDNDDNDPVVDDHVWELGKLANFFDLESEGLLRERDLDLLEAKKGVRVVDYPESAPIGIFKAGETLCTAEITKNKFVVRGPTGEVIVDRRRNPLRDRSLTGASQVEM